MKKIILALAFSGIILAGCGAGNAAKDSDSTKENSVKITAVGSTALQPLVDAAQESYTQNHPNVQISVQGGGSGTGLSQVENGSVEIGNSDVFAEEKEGVDASKLVDHKVAVVGFVPVVNKDVGVKNITKQQLIDIFTGKLKNWKELDGKDEAIQVINRASGSGTRASFEKWGLDGKESIQSQEQDSSGTVKKIVAQTPGAISYLALSYVDDSLQALQLDGVTANAKSITTNEWPIWSYEHMYTKGEPEKALADFLKYMTSDEVQSGPVKELGYLPITSMKVERAADGTIK
ncbi:phosphate ABC transporter substrate-binding protein PstS family protein [Enterococcus pingfangensis]|uniref:phosphate ABC transporter substrate-binding protein PstS family protein n=1 Tax=Enterococcus pingfangensis TaxID=2559924 RepID=UPI0010F67419|nr:phosphate ABC transporter substrate-binding protein PstS family protein [Enterococcus pingfangensis]